MFLLRQQSLDWHVQALVGQVQLNDLYEAETESEISRLLKNLPKDLGKIYARLYARIASTQRQELAWRIFHWVICAKRPLKNLKSSARASHFRLMMNSMTMTRCQVI